jgi:Ca2+-transporting ATPase
MTPSSDAPEWHALPGATVEQGLATSVATGLDDDEVRRRLERYGPNRIRVERTPSYLETFFNEIREPMILLLIGTGVLYGVWGEAADAVTIFVVILLLVTAEVLTEYRAGNAIAALSALAEPMTTVIRNGSACEVTAEALVPGDLLVLRAGSHIPADARLIRSDGLAVDESTLTGESAPVDKDADARLAPAAPLAERSTMVFAGTVVSRGRGTALVVATGAASDLGRLAALAQSVKAPRTPMQEAMASLSATLAWVAIGISILVPFLGWLLNGQPPRTMILTGLSLAFSVIPEELPIIVTMVLGLGTYRLAQRHAIVRRLPAVETLGAVTVIATDKTGTLTENRMELAEVSPAGRRADVLRLGAQANDALASRSGFVGDPLDTALLRAAQADGIDVAALGMRSSMAHEFPFDNVRKRMSIVSDRHVVVKGAPEAILSVSTLEAAQRDAVRSEVDRMAAKGLRVIAFAERTLPDEVPPTPERVELGLTFAGIAGFADPPRPEVPAAIADCRTAGIRPLMVTGDYELTAVAVADAIGIDANGHTLTGAQIDELSDDGFALAVESTNVFARTTPAQKLRIVRALQARGERVAVTGDGTNDAPALAAADIGVAMGETGTDVARDAAGIVLADDNFATIVQAVYEGRVLFANLSKGVSYYLACKLALVGVTLLAVLLRTPIPFAPIQIILMELFMDLAASAAFAAEPAESGVMSRPPRDPQEPFMNGARVSGIVMSAAGLFAAVSTAYLVTWFSGAGLPTAQTMAFVTWLLGHVFLALVMRSERDSLLGIGLFSNRVMVAWAVATVVFILLVTFVPAVRANLKAVELDPGRFGLALLLAFAGTFWLDPIKELRARHASFAA